MKLKRLNYFRELVFVLVTGLLALPCGLYWASFHTIDPDTLTGASVIQGRFDKIVCEGRLRRSNYRAKITIEEDGNSTTYRGYKFPARCSEIPTKNINLRMRVVDLTMISLEVNGRVYLPLEDALVRYNMGHRMFYTMIIAFPLWFILRPFLKRAGLIRVESR